MGFTKATGDYIDQSTLTEVGGGISWQGTPKTANFTAVAREGYFVDTTSAAITVTLPSSPSAGDEVTVVDYAGTADTNNITITSSDNINGAAADVKINYERGGVSMVYIDATQGWIAYNAANETASALPVPSVNSHFLVVAGGGGGGGSVADAWIAGGGGAGGLRTSYSTSGGGGSAENQLSFILGTNYTISIGSGGAKGISSGSNGTQGTSGSTGGDSYIQDASTDLIRSKGGGGGGGASGILSTSYSDAQGKDGGSGGGSGIN